LNLSEKNGLFFSSDNRKRLFSNRIEKLLTNVIKPDAFFCIDNKPFILFFENLRNKKVKLKEIWNFNESPIVIIIERDSVEIYNGFQFLTDKNTLRLLGTEEELNDFNYFNLVTGKTWEKYQSDFDSEHRIDSYLLSNIKATRDILIDKAISSELANSLIGKVIFVRYLIDREVKLDFEQKGKSRKWTNDEFCGILSDKNQLKNFFKYLTGKFNGDLFPISEDEIDSITDDCFSVIIDLLSGNFISTGQKSLFEFYDFSIIPVEFISNVYELFIGQVEQEKNSSYYTPLFLVDYMLAETVEKKFQQQRDFNCKVFDPACGSGIFLVETLRKIIEKYQKVNPSYSKNKAKYKEDLKKLASDSLFGIDKDRSAVNVAIFSIYLTLLDYQKPSDIETFTFPFLFENNFFVSDFFDTNAKFNEIFKKIDFDFILGNPPWKRGKGEEDNPRFIEYINSRKKAEKQENREKEIEISNAEIAQAFVLRVSDFSSIKTNISLIVTSKIFYNINAFGFRQYLLDRFSIKKVFELAPVRKEVFNKSNDKAIGPPAVLFYQYAENKNTDENIVEHITLKPSRFFSLFKVFTINRGDYKQVSQKKLKDYDYLWKVLVYGSYLDFNLIKRLKDSYSTIGEIVADETKFLVGQGATIGGGDENSATHLKRKPFLDTKKDIESFWVNPNPKNKWEYKTVHRPRDSRLYEAPMVLVKKGINSSFRSVSSVCDTDVVFTDSLTAIKSLNKDKKILQAISGILNSSFFSYLCLQTFSSSGIEREQAHETENKSIPFVESDEIASIVASISELKVEEHSLELPIFATQILIEINEKKNLLDSAVISAFSFSEMEKDILDYSVNVIIPMIMKHDCYGGLFKPLSSDNLELVEYVEVFFNQLNPIYEKMNQKLTVEIQHSEQIVGLFFKAVNYDLDTIPFRLKEKENSSILNFLISLGTEKITDRLFVQKDVRGFEQDGFYLVKPNERRLWHKAIAHLDVNEFMDAILTAGKKSKHHVQ
jgi:hypothetical protein